MTIKAKIVADSVSPDGVRLTTFELYYPRFIHSEALTHRSCSRNASSSRAIPIEKMIDAILEDTAMPEVWGLNQKGMQAKSVMTVFGERIAKGLWMTARDGAIGVARLMLAALEVPHKQIVNRLLEPFSHITVLTTATEWNNFFALRRHPDAQPEIRILADKMFEAMVASNTPKLEFGDWHLPYIDDNTVSEVAKHVLSLFPNGGLTPELAADWITDLCCKISVARCARVSYLTHDKKVPSIVDDLNLYERLMEAKPLHASPAEHQATPDNIQYVQELGRYMWVHPELHGNLVGWQQFRKFFVGENIATNPTNVSLRNVNETGVTPTLKNINKSEEK